MTASPSVNPLRRPGTQVVCGMLGIAVCLAAFALWFQWRQTRMCLEFYGAAVARQIQSAPRVELWDLVADGDSRRPVPAHRLDVSDARGLVHLRRGLVEDANFAWGDPVGIDGPGDVALAFFRDASALAPDAILVFDLDAARGTLAVGGRTGAVRLGRLRPGLEQWLEATRATPAD